MISFGRIAACWHTCYEEINGLQCMMTKQCLQCYLCWIGCENYSVRNQSTFKLHLFYLWQKTEMPARRKYIFPCCNRHTQSVWWIFFLNALFLCLWSFHILKYLLSCSHIQMSLKAVPFEVCVQTDWSFRHKGTSDMIVSLCECKISPPFEFIPCVLTWYKTSRFACGQKVLLSYNDRINQYPSGVSNDPSGI